MTSLRAILSDLAVAPSQRRPGTGEPLDPRHAGERFAALKMVGEHSLDLMVVVDEDARILFANPTALATFGVSLEEGVGTNAFSYLHPEDVPRVLRRFLELLKSPRASASDVVRAITPKGGVRELEIISTNFLEDPVVAGFVINGRDVTEQRAAERALDEAERRDVAAKLAAAEAVASSEERFRLAFEDNLAPMIITDLEDRCIAVNTAFCQMVGYDAAELLGDDSSRITYPDDVGISEESHDRILSGSTNEERFVKRYRHKNGRVIIVEASKSAARDAEGTILYFVISERDVTDREQHDHVLRLLSAVNKLGTSAISERDFGQELCNVLVRVGEYELAWIGIASPGADGGVEVLCGAGATDYLDGEMSSWWGSPDSARGHIGTAMRTGASQVVGDLRQSAPSDAWRERAERFGFASSVALPDHFGSLRAALTVYSRHAFAFDDIAVLGLEEVVAEAEFAIAHVRTVRETQSALERANAAIEARSATERALRESEQRFRLAFEGTMAPMAFNDLDNRAIAVNDAFCRMIGYSREELIGRDSRHFTYLADVGISESIHRRQLAGDVDQGRYEKRYVRKDGRIIVSEVLRSPARDAAGRILYFVSSERDVTEERELNAQLAHQALHDPLTGLANRALFDDRLIQARARVARHGGLCAVLVLDLDDFGGVNEIHGHVVGDELISGIARRFELVTRPSDTLCRFGGDEFLYLAEGLRDAQEAERVAERLLDVLAEPFTVNDLRLEQTASVGVVVIDSAGLQGSDIVPCADVALHEAKSEGKGRHVLYSPQMHVKAVNRFTLVQELRQAIAGGQITMNYQPIVELATATVVGFEALMRWHHPERGPVSPNEFIPLAEENGLIGDLGSFALTQAVAAASHWRADQEGRLPYVTVNFSAHQFRDPDVVAMVEDALARGGLAPERLIVEITESVTLSDAAETLAVLARLADVGVGVALDDFGTGYSSLSYLVRLRPRIIKIDRYFVSPTHDSRHNDTLLETIVSLGERLGVTMVAEGIETSAQFERLLDLNCEFGQGYLFSPAVPAEQAGAMIGVRFNL
ncbi:MAG: EAL domain-containing protein [Acidobacteriota bacterium]|nr:EAL domain-containing protein [Acidobacteriota bacterium]